MRLRLPALLTCVVLATACLDPLPTPTDRYGVVTAPTYQREGGVYAIRPQATFYGNTDLRYEPFIGDTCVITAFSDSSAIVGGQNFLNAGTHILTSVGSRTDSLLPIINISLRVYEFFSPNGIPFTPGDTLTVVVPGAQFPAGSMSVRTAEPFTHDTIVVPADGANLPLTWTPAVAGGTQMNFSLRYNNGFITTGHNEQIFCSLIDDGAYTIPSSYLDGWRNALNDERQTRATRVRSREVTIDTRTRMVLISSFAQPVNTVNVGTIR